MTRHVGVLRDEAGLRIALAEAYALREKALAAQDLELRNRAETALLIAASAYRRRESRGGHFREDFPNKDPEAQKYNSVIFKAADGSMKLRREPIPAMREDLKQVIEEMK